MVLRERLIRKDWVTYQGMCHHDVVGSLHYEPNLCVLADRTLLFFNSAYKRHPSSQDPIKLHPSNTTCLYPSRNCMTTWVRCICYYYLTFLRRTWLFRLEILWWVTSCHQLTESSKACLARFSCHCPWGYHSWQDGTCTCHTSQCLFRIRGCL
jgi:hypothetical protein